MIFLLSCGYGVYHRVKKGETLDDIAKKYNVRKEDIIAANMKNPAYKIELKEGEYIYIPLDRRISKQERKIAKQKKKQKREKERKFFEVKLEGVNGTSQVKHIAEKKENQARKKENQNNQIKAQKPENKKSNIHKVKNGGNNKKNLSKTLASLPKSSSRKGIASKKFNPIFPVDGGKIISGFGLRNGRLHKGIDIKTREGAPIKAAEDGVVIFSGFLKGYGNTVIIKHEGDYFTVYAHNKYNTVKEGEFVRKGSIIGYVGRTGNAEAPHLHFEVRRKTNPLNPKLFFK